MKNEKTNAFGLKTKGQEHVEPKASKALTLELRKLMLDEGATPVVDKLLSIALNDEHSGQMAAIKMVVDRILPMSEFEKIAGGGRPSVTINISGLTEPQITGETIENE